MITDINIYRLAHDVEDYYDPCSFTSTGHTGFASVITDATEDDTLVYGFSNGDYAQFSVMSRN
ncbi:MAG: hypothetical protein JKY01_12415 [Pseudomonadales bacterium]|nr:hypothetical protein [Pseudomonadales bacterium]